MLTCHSLNFLVFRKTQPFSGVEIDLTPPYPYPTLYLALFSKLYQTESDTVGLFYSINIACKYEQYKVRKGCLIRGGKETAQP